MKLSGNYEQYSVEILNTVLSVKIQTLNIVIPANISETNCSNYFFEKGATVLTKTIIMNKLRIERQRPCSPFLY